MPLSRGIAGGLNVSTRRACTRILVAVSNPRSEWIVRNPLTGKIPQQWSRICRVCCLSVGTSSEILDVPSQFLKQHGVANRHEL